MSFFMKYGIIFHVAFIKSHILCLNIINYLICKVDLQKERNSKNEINEDREIDISSTDYSPNAAAARTGPGKCQKLEIQSEYLMRQQYIRYWNCQLLPLSCNDLSQFSNAV